MYKKIATKLACRRTLAGLPVIGKSTPVAPTRMLSMVMVHEDVYHSLWMDDAKSFVARFPNASLRDLQLHIIRLCEKDPDFEYGAFVWGHWDFAPVKRALHEDAAGNFFVKKGNKWRSVFPIDRFGSLIGAHHENFKPISGYFCADNSKVARPHSF